MAGKTQWAAVHWSRPVRARPTLGLDCVGFIRGGTRVTCLLAPCFVGSQTMVPSPPCREGQPQNAQNPKACPYFVPSNLHADRSLYRVTGPASDVHELYTKTLGSDNKAYIHRRTREAEITPQNSKRTARFAYPSESRNCTRRGRPAPVSSSSPPACWACGRSTSGGPAPRSRGWPESRPRFRPPSAARARTPLSP